VNEVAREVGNERGMRQLAPNADDDDSESMTFQEVAEHLDCSYATMLLLVMRDSLPVFRLRRVGNGWRVRRSDLKKWLVEREIGPLGLGPKPRGKR